ncbi:MAG: hypothetical protein Q7R32_10815 [Dehalococcoidia bacterium]|nr:hypothetical protein [Dehalococcoidia bacterium]
MPACTLGGPQPDRQFRPGRAQRTEEILDFDDLRLPVQDAVRKIVEYLISLRYGVAHRGSVGELRLVKSWELESHSDRG